MHQNSMFAPEFSQIVLNFCKVDFASLEKSSIPLLNFILFKNAIFITHILGELLLLVICGVIFSYVFAVTPVSVVSTPCMRNSFEHYAVIFYRSLLYRTYAKRKSKKSM